MLQRAGCSNLMLEKMGILTFLLTVEKLPEVQQLKTYRRSPVIPIVFPWSLCVIMWNF